MSTAAPTVRPVPQAAPARKPRPGQMVYYWLHNPSGGATPVPAMLIQPGLGNSWHLNVHELGMVNAMTNVAYVPANAKGLPGTIDPRASCWSWMDEVE